MEKYTVKYDELTAEQFAALWSSVWGQPPALAQIRLALGHTLFRVSVFDGGELVGMARMIGDMGLCYYIKDVIVRPDHQQCGIGRLMIEELLGYIRRHGEKGTDIFVELCAMPDKIPFYERFGFSANEAQRLRMMVRAE